VHVLNIWHYVRACFEVCKLPEVRQDGHRGPNALVKTHLALIPATAHQSKFFAGVFLCFLQLFVSFHELQVVVDLGLGPQHLKEPWLQLGEGHFELLKARSAQSLMHI